MICMELMDKSLHALYRVVYEQLKQSIPLPVLGKMAESVSGQSLSILKLASYRYMLFHFPLTDTEGLILPQN